MCAHVRGDGFRSAPCRKGSVNHGLQVRRRVELKGENMVVTPLAFHVGSVCVHTRESEDRD